MRSECCLANFTICAEEVSGETRGPADLLMSNGFSRLSTTQYFADTSRCGSECLSLPPRQALRDDQDSDSVHISQPLPRWGFKVMM